VKEDKKTFLELVNIARMEYCKSMGKSPDSILLHSKNGPGSQFNRVFLEELEGFTIGHSLIENYHKFKEIQGMAVKYTEIGISETEFAVYNSQDVVRSIIEPGTPEELTVWGIFYAPLPENMRPEPSS
jgi:hypothetical protein